HFLTVCRYVERNALRAILVERAEDWRWCSLRSRVRSKDPRRIMAVGLADGASQALGEAGQHRAKRSRAGSPASLGPARLPVRGGVVVGSNCAAPRPGDDDSSPRAAQEAR